MDSGLPGLDQGRKNIKTWKQTALLEAHTHWVWDIAISPNDRILASASFDNTALLWNLDNGQPIGPPLQHAGPVESVSFSEDGKLLATSCADTNTYTWDVAAIVTEDGLNDLFLNSKANQSVLDTNATQLPAQRRPPAYRVPQGFFDGVPPNRSHSSARNSSASPGSTLLSRLFHRNRSPSSGLATPLSSPLDRARNTLKRRRQPSPAVVEVPYAPGLRRNACAREKRKKLFPARIPSASNSQPQNPNVTQSSSQPHASSSTTPPVGDATGIATTSTTSRPDATIRRAGLWTRFWLFLGCLSPEYTNGHH
ncbi:hypothetical protein C8R48DRAFT_381493 [Suillus tomentosus]|nr:hypothetical protein C8R48DRAFT_381493 [Suillus tomentosus]